MGTIIAVSSGKGGTGKSSFCCFTATALADKGYKVIILELDFGLRCIDIMLGLENNTIYDISDVFSKSCETEQAIINSNDKNVSYIAAGIDFTKKPDISEISSLCRELSDIYDFIVLDFPAGIETAARIAPAVADMIIVVSTPDPVCIRDGNMLLTAIESTAQELSGVKNSNIRLIINKFNPNFTKTGIENLDYVIDNIGVQLLGIIPESATIMSAGSNGNRLGKKGLPYKIFNAIAGRICGEHIPLLIR